MIKLMFFVLALFASTPVQAERWFIVDADKESLQAIELDTIRRSGSAATAWTARSVPNSNDPLPLIRALQRFDCGQMSASILSITTYDWENKVTSTHPGNPAKSYFAPGTVGWRLYDVACGVEIPNQDKIWDGSLFGLSDGYQINMNK